MKIIHSLGLTIAASMQILTAAEEIKPSRATLESNAVSYTHLTLPTKA